MGQLKLVSQKLTFIQSPLPKRGTLSSNKKHKQIMLIKKTKSKNKHALLIFFFF